MEETFESNQNPNESQFTIGKCFGLTGNKTDINDYEEKLSSLNELFQKKSVEEIEAIKKAIESLKSEIAKHHKSILDQQQQFSDQQVNLANKVNKILFQETNQHPIIEKKAEEILSLGLDNLKKSSQTLFKEEQEIFNKINDFNAKCNTFITSLEKRYELHLRELEKRYIEYQDFENGFLMGHALKSALKS